MKNKAVFETCNTEMVSIPRAEYDADKAYISELENKNQWLMEQLRILKKRAYGTSSEKTSEEVYEQLSLIVTDCMR